VQINDGSLAPDRWLQNSRFIGRIHALRFSAMPAERKSPIERAADNPQTITNPPVSISSRTSVTGPTFVLSINSRTRAATGQIAYFPL